jgi:hypothetical protein
MFDGMELRMGGMFEESEVFASPSYQRAYKKGNILVIEQPNLSLGGVYDKKNVKEALNAFAQGWIENATRPEKKRWYKQQGIDTFLFVYGNVTTKRKL